MEVMDWLSRTTHVKEAQVGWGWEGWGWLWVKKQQNDPVMPRAFRRATHDNLIKKNTPFINSNKTSQEQMTILIQSSWKS